MIYYPEHATESHELYWIWGIVGTLAAVLMIPLSILYIRKSSYELFLIAHILLAVFVIAGSWYHVEFLFTRKWGYEFWLYAACAVWFFDRVIRVMRIWKVGIQKVHVREVTDSIVRIDIPAVNWGLKPGKHVYAFFPTLSLRPWENHPFSIVPTAILSQGVPAVSSGRTSDAEPPIAEDIEKTAYTQSKEINTSSGPTCISGVTLFVRKAKGMTKRLKTQSNLPVLLEGPYTSSHTSSVTKTDRLVLISGGIGITGTFPFIHTHINTKLYWSCKAGNSTLIEEFSAAIAHIGEKEILVGGRFNVSDLIEKETVVGGGFAVIVCGPAGMCDDVRQTVVDVGKQTKVVIDLHVEAFSW
jgi:predicted ferric reductase